MAIIPIIPSGVGDSWWSFTIDTTIAAAASTESKIQHAQRQRDNE